jgi:hypothetical protein
MVKIGWGTPALITADIGIFIEVPAPVRLLFLGQVECLLPEAHAAIVEIHLDVVGVLDIQKKLLTFNASLRDSRVMVYPISGDAAFLLGWGSSKKFALSLGGFHPKFDTPAPSFIFADLDRLKISISAGKHLELGGTVYYALTPNSLQFGARIDLYASAGDASLSGYLRLDTLIYFSPFSFEVDIGAGVSVKYHGKSLADIHLEFTLAGPGAWSARGRAEIEALGLSATVKFSFEWGKNSAPKMDSVNAWPAVQKAFARAGNWSAMLPPKASQVEMLASRNEEASTLVVHPSGRLEIIQRVVPLETTLDKVGNAPVKSYDRFKIKEVQVGDEVIETDDIKEHFARGQFEDISKNDRLSLPAFERMKAGVRAKSSVTKLVGTIEEAGVEYDSILFNVDRTATLQSSRGTIGPGAAKAARLAVARRRTAARRGTDGRFAEESIVAKVSGRDDSYCIAISLNLLRAAVDASHETQNRGLTRMAADRLLADEIALHPERASALVVVPEYELAGAA